MVGGQCPVFSFSLSQAEQKVCKGTELWCLRHGHISKTINSRLIMGPELLIISQIWVLIYSHYLSIAVILSDDLTRVNMSVLVFTLLLFTLLSMVHPRLLRVNNIDGKSSSTVKLVQHPGNTDYQQLSLCMRWDTRTAGTMNDIAWGQKEHHTYLNRGPD